MKEDPEKFLMRFHLSVKKEIQLVFAVRCAFSVVQRRNSELNWMDRKKLARINAAFITAPYCFDI